MIALDGISSEILFPLLEVGLGTFTSQAARGSQRLASAGPLDALRSFYLYK
jgi:hypothetical protein